MVSKTFAKVVLTVDWGLTAELFEHFGSTGKPVTRFTDRDVEDELLNLELPHGILRLVFGLFAMSAKCNSRTNLIEN